MSVTTTWRAPTWRAMAAAITPIGPAPVMTTSSPAMGNESAVWVALPKGSKTAPRSGSRSSGCTHTLPAGMTTKSANAPSRFTPTPLVWMQTWRRPARQLRHMPQTMCPSPEARWPTWTLVTSSPTSTTSP